MSRSIAIQMDAIQRENQRRSRFAFVAGVVVAGALVAVLFSLRAASTGDEGASGSDPTPETTVAGSEATATELQLGEEIIFEAEDEDEDDGNAEEDDGADAIAALSSAHVPTQEKVPANPDAQVEPAAAVNQPESGSPQVKKAGANIGQTMKRPKRPRDGRRKSAARNSGASAAEPAVPAKTAGRSAIFTREDNIGKRRAPTGRATLSKVAAEAGFKKISRSIALCRERHQRRGGPLSARKVYITVDVVPDGHVSAVRLAPKSVTNTVFERCLQSHRGRWKFESFDGDTLTIKKTVVLQ